MTKTELKQIIKESVREEMRKKPIREADLSRDELNKLLNDTYDKIEVIIGTADEDLTDLYNDLYSMLGNDVYEVWNKLRNDRRIGPFIKAIEDWFATMEFQINK